jgi:preprotein translocase subunit YajC
MGLVVLLALFAGMWLLLVRPQQQRLRAQRTLIASLNVGDQVVTAGGIVGRIIRLDERDAAIEVAPGIILTFLRPAVSRKLEPEGDAVADALADDGGSAAAVEGARSAGAPTSTAGAPTSTAGAPASTAGAPAGTADEPGSADDAPGSATNPGPVPGDEDTEEGTV